MKVSRSKTEYMCVNEREDKGTVSMEGVEVAKLDDFKCLVSTVQSTRVQNRDDEENVGRMDQVEKSQECRLG